MDVTFCISRAASVPVAGKDDRFVTYYPKGQTDTVLSIQPDGSRETRPLAEAGAWETWYPSKDGNRAIFAETAEVYAVPLVD